MFSRLPISRVLRSSSPVVTKQFITKKCFSSRVVLTGNDIISPTIGLNDDQKEFYELAKQVSEMVCMLVDINYICNIHVIRVINIV